MYIYIYIKERDRRGAENGMTKQRIWIYPKSRYPLTLSS